MNQVANTGQVAVVDVGGNALGEVPSFRDVAHQGSAGDLLDPLERFKPKLKRVRLTELAEINRLWPDTWTGEIRALTGHSEVGRARARKSCVVMRPYGFFATTFDERPGWNETVISAEFRTGSISSPVYTHGRNHFPVEAVNFLGTRRATQQVPSRPMPVARLPQAATLNLVLSLISARRPWDDQHSC